MLPLKVGLIGFGYWGPNIIRSISSIDGIKVVAIADARDNRLKIAGKIYKDAVLTAKADELLAMKELDAIVIATPVSTHYVLAKKALLAGKHVWLEKPMTTSVKKAKELHDLANSVKRTLFVDHTFLYTGAVQKIKQLADDGTLGQLTYYDSVRVNLGLFQPDINVVWDLAPHDVSILLHLTGLLPTHAQAAGICHTSNGIENIAYLSLTYAQPFFAHIHCSWTSPVKIRQTLVGGTKKMIVYNDMEPSEKVKVYDSGFDIRKTVEGDDNKRSILVDYRTGDIFAPKLPMHEALVAGATDFVQALSTGSKPLASSELGVHVVAILEAAESSIKNQGVKVPIDYGDDLVFSKVG